MHMSSAGYAAPVLTPSGCYSITSVVDRIRVALRSGGAQIDNRELFTLCIFLARSIDFAVSYNDIPEKAYELPSLIKQVYQRKNDVVLHSALMLLIISIKNACSFGWFAEKDTSELLLLANEISDNFSSAGNFPREPRDAQSIISGIMTRFYPRLKLGRLILSLEAKPGYEVLVADFHIAKNTTPSATETMRLFVAQRDNVETSSCITSPPDVNFILNGKGVEKRNNTSMEIGPQLPTDVTSMLLPGTNLIQAIGNFNGNYIIGIAYMSPVTPNSETASVELEYYVQPASSVTFPSDSEVIEGPSRVSLSCPISFRRIKTPVKGHHCRHHQCFDYDNYMEINSRKPTWRCPHCNQPVSWCDLRLDQNMVKILREVGGHVLDVLISEDGSWKIFSEENDNGNNAIHQTFPTVPSVTAEQEEKLEEEQLDVLKKTINGHVVDLTTEVIEGTVPGSENDTCHVEDRKPSVGQESGFGNVFGCPLGSTVDASVQTSPAANPQMMPFNDLWSRIYSASVPSTSNTNVGMSGVGTTIATSRMMDTNINSHSSSSFPFDALVPILTDAVSPALNHEASEPLGSSYQNLHHIRHMVSGTDSLILQPGRHENSPVNGTNEGGRPPIPRHISRNPIAVQALPAQNQASSLLQPAHLQRLFKPPQQPINSSCGSTPQAVSSQSPTSAPCGASVNVANSNAERQQAFCRSQTNPLPVSDAASPAFGMAQLQDCRFALPGNQTVQPIIGLPSTSQIAGSNLRLNPSDQQQHKSVYRFASISQTDHQNFNHHHQLHPSTEHIAPPAQRPSFTTGAVTRPMAPGGAQRALAAGGSPWVSTVVGDHQLRHRSSVDTASGLQPGTSSVPDLPSEQNWRPTGWMRGSLSGRAYSPALGQLMLQPTSQGQRLMSSNPWPTQTTSTPSQLEVLIANNINAHGKTPSRTATHGLGSGSTNNPI